MDKKTGTKEWSDHSLNFQKGCENDCRYCYARHFAVEGRFKYMTQEQWDNPTIDQKKVDKKYGKLKGVIMFPTTHDIVPGNISEYCCVLRKLLDAGNDVLIVSKPNWECISLICEGFKEHRDKILFRFTIGSTSDDVLRFWEPNAPSVLERLSCLQYAFEAGYKTSVSCEPYLDPYVVYTYTACKPYITDSFWVGKLRHFNSRVKLDDATPEQIKKYVDTLKAASGDDVVRGIYRLLDGQPFIQWKDSIKEIMGL